MQTPAETPQATSQRSRDAKGPAGADDAQGEAGGASARRADLGSIGGRKLEQRDYSYNLPLSGP